MVFDGKIIEVLPAVHGISQDGRAWERTDVVVEYGDKVRGSILNVLRVMVSSYHEDRNLTEGNEGSFNIKLKSEPSTDKDGKVYYRTSATLRTFTPHKY